LRVPSKAQKGGEAARDARPTNEARWRSLQVDTGDTGRLDDMILQRVRFFTQDRTVEGHEEAVLRGEAGNIQRDHPRLMSELEDDITRVRYTRRVFECLKLGTKPMSVREHKLSRLGLAERR